MTSGSAFETTEGWRVEVGIGSHKPGAVHFSFRMRPMSYGLWNFRGLLASKANSSGPVINLHPILKHPTERPRESRRGNPLLCQGVVRLHSNLRLSICTSINTLICTHFHPYLSQLTQEFDAMISLMSDSCYGPHVACSHVCHQGGNDWPARG